MPEPITALRHAIATVRAQIPKGELTRQSVERLLAAAEAVCAAKMGPSAGTETKPAPRRSQRQEARERWAEIARRNAQKQQRSPAVE
jgi:hypothetical protein